MCSTKMMFQQIATIFLFIIVASEAALNYNVHLFYYPWYGAPGTSGRWVHWNGPGKDPSKGDITSNFFPLLGAYDSCDAKVLAQHMQWISSTGAGTIITSWWGRGGFEDQCVNKILDAAHQKLIKVGFHLEPYDGRTPQSTVSDVQYISQKYGNHPAYFRDPKFGNRDAFYIFYSLQHRDWSAIEPLRSKHIILAQTGDQSVQHFSGFYTYAVGNDPKTANGWRSMNEFCKQKGYVWSPTLGPGYIDRRAVPNSKAAILERNNGKTYDDNWHILFDSGISPWVSITSFNEWHEGTVIEPATSAPPAGIPYLTFNGAFNKTGKAAETSYLERTAYWVQEFTRRSQLNN